jgi:hypothetical protein
VPIRSGLVGTDLSRQTTAIKQARALVSIQAAERSNPKQGKHFDRPRATLRQRDATPLDGSPR